MSYLAMHVNNHQFKWSTLIFCQKLHFVNSKDVTHCMLIRVLEPFKVAPSFNLSSSICTTLIHLLLVALPRELLHLNTPLSLPSELWLTGRLLASFVCRIPWAGWINHGDCIVYLSPLPPPYIDYGVVIHSLTPITFGPWRILAAHGVGPFIIYFFLPMRKLSLVIIRWHLIMQVGFAEILIWQTRRSVVQLLVGKFIFMSTQTCFELLCCLCKINEQLICVRNQLFSHCVYN